MISLAEEAWFQAPSLRRVFSVLNAEGGEARIVGGAVRDALIGRPVADIDLATTLTPDEVIARADAAGIKSVPTGLAHGTVTLVIDGKPFEVTTLRRDVTTDGRHAEVAFTTDWEEDARRRDLTINALYADAEGRIYDHVGGLPDIESRTIRFIGVAAERVAEDYLRVLRFFRFFAWYGSGRPDAEGLKACARARDHLASLSAERVWSETKKLLTAPDPGRALLWMRTSGVLTAILPESEKWGIDAIPGLVSAEDAFGWTPDPLLRLVAMLPPDAERIAALCQRLRLSKSEAARLTRWAACLPIPEKTAEAALDRRLYRDGTDGALMRLKLDLALAHSKRETEPEALQRIAALQRLLARTERFEKPRFPLTGADVLAAGVPAGPAVGDILSMLEEQWVAENFAADRKSLLTRLATAVADAKPSNA
ncbi:poly(A) polymerase [Xaviernesmea oryzae]|uniref:Poly(A) polymerase n=1 Tax=Xaviernesmea oryzae TaxID=464029 RepID=A0A1Q9AVB6_9HYPH|nr:CCA tRNA nucleotidyltransferase [Xaviernesmea oryzae]OLP59395.1 poly(A) polymerase [Xaviernesmea oryzae]SEL61774.1 poly(A) polymerase [Xaviernesmea oryzae]